MILQIISVLFILFLLWKFQNYFIIVPPNHMVIVERFGKFYKQIGPGFHFIVPYIERIHRVKWSYIDQKSQRVRINEYMIPCDNNQMDVPPIHCTSKDEMQVIVDVTLFYSIVDGKKAAYSTVDSLNLFYQSSVQAIRNQIASIDSIRLIGSGTKVGGGIKDRINKTMKCGIECNKILVQSIDYTNKEIASEKQRIQTELKTLEYKSTLQKVEYTMEIEKRALERDKLLSQGFTHEQIIQLRQIDALKTANTVYSVFRCFSSFLTFSTKCINITQ